MRTPGRGRTRSQPAGLILCTVVMLGAACTSSPSDEKGQLPPGHGGTLTVVMTQTQGSPYGPGAFDPQVSGYPASLEVARCCLFRTLMSYNGRATSGGGGVPHPDLAARLPSVSNDGLTWTFQIKPGIHYAPPLQQVEVTAPDFIRGIERALLPVTGKVAKAVGCRLGVPCQLDTLFAQFFIAAIVGAAAYATGNTTTISGLEAPSSHTLVVRLVHPYGTLPYLFALQSTVPIPPKPGDPGAALGVADGHELDYGRGFAVGTGPYMVEGGGAVDYSLPRDQQEAAAGAAQASFTMVRNPSWDPSTDPLRVAYPDRISVIGSKDVPEGEAWVEEGKADLVFDWNAPLDLVNRYEASPELRDRVFTDPLDAVSTITLNLAVPPLDDLHVRRAINFAIARSDLVPIFTKYFTTSNVASHLAPDGLENDLLLNYTPYGDGTGDLAAAKAEMAQSRFGDQSGMCAADACRSLTLTVPQDSIERVKMGESMIKDLAPLGIDVRLDPVDDGHYFAALTDPSSQTAMTLIAFVKDFPSASDYFPSTFGSKNLVNGNGDPSLLGATPGQLRKWGYGVRSTPNVDDRMELCQEATFETQVSCWVSLDQYMMEAVVPWVPLLAWTGSVIVSSRVKAFSFDQSTPFPEASLDRIRL